MHLMKHGLDSISGISLENMRQAQEYSNEDIDKSRSHLNYDLAPHDMGMRNFIYKRTSEVDGGKRKNGVAWATWVVTLPKTISEDKEKDFFELTYKFLEERYGKDNVASANVHLDEATPHMHFNFTPVQIDENGNEKFNARAIITRNELKQCQVELDKLVCKEFGLEIGEGILNGATVNGNKAVAQMKYEKKVTELNEKEKKIEAKIEDLEQNLLVKHDQFQEYAQIEAKMGDFEPKRGLLGYSDKEVEIALISAKSLVLENEELKQQLENTHKALKSANEKLERVENDRLNQVRTINELNKENFYFSKFIEKEKLVEKFESFKQSAKNLQSEIKRVLGSWRDKEYMENMPDLFYQVRKVVKSIFGTEGTNDEEYEMMLGKYQFETIRSHMPRREIYSIENVEPKQREREFDRGYER